MAKRELIYKDEAQRAALQEKDNIVPQVDELWRARIQYWPGQVPTETIVQIYYIWRSGDIAFIPILAGSTSERILTSQCVSFELLERLGE